jgi:hypothetical protein
MKNIALIGHVSVRLYCIIEEKPGGCFRPQSPAHTGQYLNAIYQSRRYTAVAQILDPRKKRNHGLKEERNTSGKIYFDNLAKLVIIIAILMKT